MKARSTVLELGQDFQLPHGAEQVAQHLHLQPPEVEPQRPGKEYLPPVEHSDPVIIVTWLEYSEAEMAAREAEAKAPQRMLSEFMAVVKKRLGDDF